MTPAERVAVREAQAKLDAILDEPRVTDERLRRLLDRLLAMYQTPVEGAPLHDAVRELCDYWANDA